MLQSISNFFDGIRLIVKSLKTYYYYPRLAWFVVISVVCVVLVLVGLISIFAYSKQPIAWNFITSSSWEELRLVLHEAKLWADSPHALASCAKDVIGEFFWGLMHVSMVYATAAYFKGSSVSILHSIKRAWLRSGILLIFALFFSIIPQVILFKVTIIKQLVDYLVKPLLFFIYPLIAFENVTALDILVKSVRMGLKNYSVILGTLIGIFIIPFLLVTPLLFILIPPIIVDSPLKIIFVGYAIVFIILIVGMISFLPSIMATAMYCYLHNRPIEVFSHEELSSVLNPTE